MKNESMNGDEAKVYFYCTFCLSVVNSGSQRKQSLHPTGSAYNESSYDEDCVLPGRVFFSEKCFY